MKMVKQGPGRGSEKGKGEECFQWIAPKDFHVPVPFGGCAMTLTWGGSIAMLSGPRSSTLDEVDADVVSTS